MERIGKTQNSRKNFTKMSALWLMAVFCIFTFAFASENPVEVSTETVEVTAAEPVAIDSMNGAAIQSISFVKDMTIKDALRFLALKYKKNIVPTAKVDGMITITNLYDVTFEEALQAIIGVNKFEVDGNFIRVFTAEEYELIKNDKRRMEYKVFELYYLTADEARKLVTPLISDQGLIESSTASEVGVSEGDELAVIAGGSSPALRDVLVVKDFPENLEQIEILLGGLDSRPLQVLIESTILSATLNESMEFGVDLNLANGTAIDGQSSVSNIINDAGDIAGQTSASTPVSQIAGWGQAGNPIETSGFASIGGNGLRLGISSGNISMFVSALEAITDVTVLANPKILALNKQVGTVFIGQKLGYRSSTTVSASGVASEGEVKFLNSGTKLSFRPYIADDGFIRMDIYPKDSSAALNADGVPTETTAELTTNIMVKDGETVVIGGLFRDDITSSRSQVPILGDLPLLGGLFRGTTDSSVRKEVIILLTPHIIENPSELENEKRVADIGRKRQGAIDEMQWFSRTRRADDSYAKAVALYSDGDLEGALCELNFTLRLRPTYHEAMWLREKIIRESGDSKGDTLERIMKDVVEREETEKWMRL